MPFLALAQLNRNCAKSNRKNCLYIVKHRHGPGESSIPLSFAAGCTLFHEPG